MLERLKQHAWKNEKVLIFSDFTSCLDLLEKFIKSEGNVICKI